MLCRASGASPSLSAPPPASDARWRRLSAKCRHRWPWWTCLLFVMLGVVVLSLVVHFDRVRAVEVRLFAGLQAVYHDLDVFTHARLCAARVRGGGKGRRRVAVSVVRIATRNTTRIGYRASIFLQLLIEIDHAREVVVPTAARQFHLFRGHHLQITTN